MTSIPSGSNGLNKRRAVPSSESSFNLGTPPTPKNQKKLKNAFKRAMRHANEDTSGKWKDLIALNKKYSGKYLNDRLKGDIRLQQQSVGSTNVTSDHDYTVKNTKTTTVKKEGSSIAFSISHNHINKILSCCLTKETDTENRTPFSTIATFLKTNEASKFSPTKDEKEAIKAFQDAGFNWFTLLKRTNGKENRDEILTNVRNLEKAITKIFNDQIKSTYTSISEGDYVTQMNKLYHEVFGSEAGQLFDTNFYTAGVILEPGFKLEGEQENDWKVSMDTFSKIKMAQQFINDSSGDIDTAKNNFDAFVAQQTGQISNEEKKEIQTQQFTKAWAKATERHQAISEKKMDMFPGPEHRTIIAGKYHVITEPEKELAVMNRLYEEKLGAIDDKRTEISNLERQIDSLQTELTTEKRPDNLEAPTNHVDTLKETLSELKREAIDLQSEALLYANEPYYSQATVVHVVAGMQMEKTAEDYPILADKDCAFYAAEENFGDLKKCLLEYPIGEQFPGDKHLLKASKYAKRALDCLKISLSDIEGEEAEIFKSKLEQMSASIDKIYAKKQGESDDQTPNSTLIKNDFFEPIATMPDGIANEFHSYMMELLAESRQFR